jgi:bifunctional non-homologous end joining protein LigD
MGRGLPRYPPMLAELGQLPGDDERWAHEVKWDGVRGVLYADPCGADGVRIMSRNDKDTTAAWPELQALAAAVSRRMVLDGEIVAVDAKGQSSFKALQPRMHQRQPAKIKALMESTPITYMIFDVMHLDDEPLIGRPYIERRRILEGLGIEGPHWAVPPPLPGPGTAALTQSQQLGLEGIVCKRLDSVYRPGRRDRAWTKVKNVRTQEVVLVGWRPGTGRRQGGIGSLLLAVPDEAGELRFVGGVGTGFTEAMLADLAELLGPLERPDPPLAEPLPADLPRDAHWVEPRLVGESAFSEWTDDGHLRHPAWRGLRPDKDVTDVQQELLLQRGRHG